MNSMGFDWFVLLGFGIGGFLLVFFVGLVKIVNFVFLGGGGGGGYLVTGVVDFGLGMICNCFVSFLLLICLVIPIIDMHLLLKGFIFVSEEVEEKLVKKSLCLVAEKVKGKLGKLLLFGL